MDEKLHASTVTQEQKQLLKLHNHALLVEKWQVCKQKGAELLKFKCVVGGSEHKQGAQNPNS
jgi:hypothetical protein